MKKLLSVVLCVTLIWTSGSLAEAVAAAPDVFVAPSDLPQFQLQPPGRLGRVVDYFNASREVGQRGGGVVNPLVILIQDLHAHYGVQKNIAGILDFLDDKIPHPPTSPLPHSQTPPFALAVEGASGPIDSSVMALFPDEKVKLAASDYLMREGELTGAEYFAIKRGIPKLLVGAENENFYLVHRNLFRKTLADRDELVNHLKSMKANVDRLPRYVFRKNKALIEFQKMEEAYNKGEMGTVEFIGRLINQSRAMDVKHDFPTLSSFASNSHFGTMDQVRAETAEFLTQTQGRLSPQEKKDLQVLAKNHGTTAYYLYLRELIYKKQLFLAAPPELAQYLEYIHTAQTMGMDRVTHEARELAFRIKLALAQSSELRAQNPEPTARSPERTKSAAADLVQVQHDLDLLLRLADLQASELEVRDFAPRLNQFVALTKALVEKRVGADLRVRPPSGSDSISSNFNFGQAQRPAPTHFDETKIRRLISSSIDFYVMALVRNKPMLENTLELITSAGRSATRPADHQPPRPATAVLVAGGFHTFQLTQLLREKNVSYLVITPTVEHVTAADHDLYVKRLSGQLLTEEDIHAAARDKDSNFYQAARTQGLVGPSKALGPLAKLWTFHKGSNQNGLAIGDVLTSPIKNTALEDMRDLRDGRVPKMVSDVHVPDVAQLPAEVTRLIEETNREVHQQVDKLITELSVKKNGRRPWVDLERDVLSDGPKYHLVFVADASGKPTGEIWVHMHFSEFRKGLPHDQDLKLGLLFRIASLGPNQITLMDPMAELDGSFVPLEENRLAKGHMMQLIEEAQRGLKRYAAELFANANPQEMRHDAESHWLFRGSYNGVPIDEFQMQHSHWLNMGKSWPDPYDSGTHRLNFSRWGRGIPTSLIPQAKNDSAIRSKVVALAVVFLFVGAMIASAVWAPAYPASKIQEMVKVMQGSDLQIITAGFNMNNWKEVFTGLSFVAIGQSLGLAVSPGYRWLDLLLFPNKDESSDFPGAAQVGRTADAMRKEREIKATTIITQQLNIGGIMRLASQGVSPEDIFANYDTSFDVYVIKDAVMDIIAQAAKMESGGAFNLLGLVGLRESDFELMKKGDKAGLMTAAHEHRHNDYRQLHGDPPYEIEQKLVDELYAYFTSFLDIYGNAALAGVRSSGRYGRGTYSQIVASTLYHEYLTEIADAKSRQELGIRMTVAAFILDEFARSGKADMAMEYLKTVSSLDQVLAMVSPTALEKLFNHYKAFFKYQGEMAVPNYKELNKAFTDFKNRSRSPAQQPTMPERTPNNLSEIAQLAASKQTYKNLDNKALYVTAIRAKGITGTVAIDVGSGSNNLPAEGLEASGFKHVYRVDHSGQLGGEGAVDDVIMKKRGDGTNLPFENGSVDLVVHNQDLAFVAEYAHTSDAGLGLLHSRPDLKSKLLNERILPSEVSDHAVNAAIQETSRVLRPGGWVLIKPGRHEMPFEMRHAEVPRIVSDLKALGFTEIEIVTVKGTKVGPGDVTPVQRAELTRMFSWDAQHANDIFTPIDIPVFIFARKPNPVPAPPLNIDVELTHPDTYRAGAIVYRLGVAKGDIQAGRWALRLWRFYHLLHLRNHALAIEAAAGLTAGPIKPQLSREERLWIQNEFSPKSWFEFLRLSTRPLTFVIEHRPHTAKQFFEMSVGAVGIYQATWAAARQGLLQGGLLGLALDAAVILMWLVGYQDTGLVWTSPTLAIILSMTTVLLGSMIGGGVKGRIAGVRAHAEYNAEHEDDDAALTRAQNAPESQPPDITVRAKFGDYEIVLDQTQKMPATYVRKKEEVKAAGSTKPAQAIRLRDKVTQNGIEYTVVGLPNDGNHQVLVEYKDHSAIHTTILPWPDIASSSDQPTPQQGTRSRGDLPVAAKTRRQKVRDTMTPQSTIVSNLGDYEIVLDETHKMPATYVRKKEEVKAAGSTKLAQAIRLGDKVTQKGIEYTVVGLPNIGSRQVIVTYQVGSAIHTTILPWPDIASSPAQPPAAESSGAPASLPYWVLRAGKDRGWWPSMSERTIRGWGMAGMGIEAAVFGWIPFLVFGHTAGLWMTAFFAVAHLPFKLLAGHRAREGLISRLSPMILIGYSLPALLGLPTLPILIVITAIHAIIDADQIFRAGVLLVPDTPLVAPQAPSPERILVIHLTDKERAILAAVNTAMEAGRDSEAKYKFIYGVLVREANSTMVDWSYQPNLPIIQALIDPKEMHPLSSDEAKEIFLLLQQNLRELKPPEAITPVPVKLPRLASILMPVFTLLEQVSPLEADSIYLSCLWLHLELASQDKTAQRKVITTWLGDRWDPLESTCRHASLSIL